MVLNSPEGLAALESYLSLAAPDVAPPNPGAIAQGELIQLLAAGRAARNPGPGAVPANSWSPGAALAMMALRGR